MSEQNEGSDRRQAVRMDDRILFAWAPVATADYEKVRGDFEKGIPPYPQGGLQDIGQHVAAQGALSRLRSRDADLAEFLHFLDNKLDQLLKEARGDHSPLDQLSHENVSLSSGGMAFFTVSQLPPGEHLELHLVLEPDHLYIFCLGEVVDCEEKGGGGKPFRISVKFTLITDDDREKLIHHLFRLQTIALRKRRQQ
ncbi:MAG: PilZ domain-containing protein [Desulfobacteraceae bacterium]|nr:PilZ domain-containing protein [Desulfobacteraceae bacterium]